MAKEKLNLLLTIMTITALIGLLLLFFSPSLGTTMAELWLTNRGEANTGVYQIVTERFIINFQIIGSVFFILSLIVSIAGAFLSVVEKQK